MADDISLSQTLGGLRIANPDDSPNSPSPLASDAAVPAPNSTTFNPSRSSPSSSDTAVAAKPHLVHSLDNSWHSGMVMDPAPVNAPPRSVPYMQDSSSYNASNANQLSHRQSMPLAHQAQQQGQLFPPSNSVLNAPRSYGPLARPISGIYNHPNVSGGSQSSTYSAYRYGDEPPQVVGPPNRTSSRAAPGSATRAAPEYMMASSQLPPPRRSSRRISPGTSLPSTPGVMPPVSSYVENGPLHSSEEWKEKGAAVGIRREVDAEGRTITKVMKKGVKDFEFGRTLGEGSYSTVLAATDRTTLREYAIKVLDKRHIIKEKKVKYVNIEKDTLNRLNSHPGIVRLYYTFQDERSLYFVLDLAANGELLATLKKIGTFDEECTRFYGAQILDAVAYMHSRGVIHRDLKPENVLLDSNMHIKITDFGTGKILDSKSKAQNGGDILPGARDSDRSASFVGTAEYVSPELLTNKEGGKPTDLWAFGCIIYQLLTGRPPFKGTTEYLTFEKILALDYSFPLGFPSVARDLVERLLVPDPSKRLTVEHVMNHEFFDGINWGSGLWKQKAPRLKPYVAPTPDPIRLNGPNITSAPTAAAALNLSSLSRPLTSRIITELPAPSQLDIEWSPVLTRQNERILKLGNLIVTVSPQPISAISRNGDSQYQEPPKKFHRFFMSGNTTKKRQRLVMVTSSGRIILAASGGDEKKAKLEITLLSPGTSWRCFKDNKGLTIWCVDTREKHILFEAPLSPPPEPDGTAIATTEWLDTLTTARDLGFMQQSLSGSYSGESAMEISSQMPSPAGSSLAGTDAAFLDADAALALEGVNIPSSSRLRKEDDTESLRKGRKRFSRRQSKGGLAAVF